MSPPWFTCLLLLMSKCEWLTAYPFRQSDKYLEFSAGKLLWIQEKFCYRICSNNFLFSTSVSFVQLSVSVFYVIPLSDYSLPSPGFCSFFLFLFLWLLTHLPRRLKATWKWRLGCGLAHLVYSCGADAIEVYAGEYKETGGKALLGYLAGESGLVKCVETLLHRVPCWCYSIHLLLFVNVSEALNWEVPRHSFEQCNLGLSILVYSSVMGALWMWLAWATRAQLCGQEPGESE